MNRKGYANNISRVTGTGKISQWDGYSDLHYTLEINSGAAWLCLIYGGSHTGSDCAQILSIQMLRILASAAYAIIAVEPGRCRFDGLRIVQSGLFPAQSAPHICCPVSVDKAPLPAKIGVQR